MRFLIENVFVCLKEIFSEAGYVIIPPKNHGFLHPLFSETRTRTRNELRAYAVSLLFMVAVRGLRRGGFRLLFLQGRRIDC